MFPLRGFNRDVVKWRFIFRSPQNWYHLQNKKENFCQQAVWRYFTQAIGIGSAFGITVLGIFSSDTKYLSIWDRRLLARLTHTGLCSSCLAAQHFQLWNGHFDHHGLGLSLILAHWGHRWRLLRWGCFICLGFCHHWKWWPTQRQRCGDSLVGAIPLSWQCHHGNQTTSVGWMAKESTRTVLPYVPCQPFSILSHVYLYMGVSKNNGRRKFK